MRSLLLTTTFVASDIESFLRSAGDIFKVFDKQDSGCVSYGVSVGRERWFVKYSEDDRSIANMKNALSFNTLVTHPMLPRLCHSFETNQGFALVYEWVDGQVLGTPEFAGEEGRSHPDSPFYRFQKLPVDRILRVLNAVFELHAFLESKGYVAVDFYDGCIIYDFDREYIHLCDFDHYVQGPFLLKTDRLPGSTRFMAPEEFVKGSIIDYRTNVFTMGATAFVFLANAKRERAHWRASDSLYDVAQKATSPDRRDRFDNVAMFYDHWITAGSVR